MTASDLSAITKPWPEQKRVAVHLNTFLFYLRVILNSSQAFASLFFLKQIANLVTMEFFAQGDKEKKEFKIKPIVGHLFLITFKY